MSVCLCRTCVYPNRWSFNGESIYRSYLVSLDGYDTWVDMIILDMVDFNVILVIDWFTLYGTIFYSYAKTMTIVMLGRPRMEWKSLCCSYPVKSFSISVIKS